MKREELFSKLQHVVQDLNYIEDSSKLIFLPEHNCYRVSVFKPCFFISQVAVEYLISVGVPFSIDVVYDNFYFDFVYEAS